MDSYTGFQTVTEPQRAVWAGRGLVGIEIAENMIHRGLQATLVERLDQVMPLLAPEMARMVDRHTTRHGVWLELNDGGARFDQSADSGPVLDVQNPAEPAVESVPGALIVPLPELRGSVGELPRVREIPIFGRSGQRACYATRILLRNGFDACNLASDLSETES